MATIPSFPIVNTFLPGAVRTRATFPTVAAIARDPASFAEFISRTSPDLAQLTVANQASFADTATQADQQTFAEAISNAPTTFADELASAEDAFSFAESQGDAGQAFAAVLANAPASLGAILRGEILRGPNTPAEIAAANRDGVSIQSVLAARGLREGPGRLQVEGGARLARDAELAANETEPLPPQPAPTTTAPQQAFTPTVLPGETLDLLI